MASEVAPGSRREWRSDPAIVSGGQLMEQGIHVDRSVRLVSRQGEPGDRLHQHEPLAHPASRRQRLRLAADDGAASIASVHSSLTQWTNLFELELFGEKGSLTVRGLGASYGVEELIVSQHDPTAPFSHKTIEYRGGDSSWKSEWEEFTRAIAERRQPLGSGEDGLTAMQIVNAVYSASANGQAVVLP